MTPRRRRFPFVPVALGALASLLLAGCTAVGFGVGALYDMHGGKRTVGELASVRTGTNITMWLRDGRKLNGEFLGCRDSLGATPVAAPTDAARGSLVPLRAIVVLGTQSGPQQVPIDLVERISVPVVRGKVVGALVGLLGDAFLFYIAWLTNTGGIQD